MFSVLIVDDSPVARELIGHILSGDPRLTVVGTACNGADAVRKAKELRPHVITMDVHMPEMDGYEATRQIMEQCPTPIVIVSASTSTDEVGNSFKALEAGAVALFERPSGLSNPNFEQEARGLRDLVRALAEVPVVRRWAKRSAADRNQEGTQAVRRNNMPAGIVCIGASTGGPVALQTILAALGQPFPLPIVVVQHIAAGFLDGFVDWMSKSTGFSVRAAEEGEQLERGVAHVAPDNQCMTVTRDGRIRLVPDCPACTLRPSVGHLFQSAATAFGDRSIAVLLTGMGKDGAADLLAIRNAGGKTIAQDKASSVVFGMPGEAARLGAAEQLLCPQRIGHRLNELASAMALR